ncbi:hypothetical protein BFJ63_vAg13742 [Fusarium oxysporum f. sp. narcissi]|uniref:Enoyl reductase (ER) domain-containing protein n=1 Tax=Fusarium oxysporum f. sp. narcissi TaxID=451672 RepID=A0A4Q2VDN9_FUSOX|nr:hypothetical protein BFJ63_vAg13742 [Fusarium oxysporum f. sp. narcissi]
MYATQKAAIVERFGEPYTFKQIPRPSKPRGQDLLIKVLAASYCHSDTLFAQGELAQELPREGGHEFVGEVVSIGPDVSSHKAVTVGQRVGVPGRAYHPCGTCWECTHPGKDEMGYSPYCPYARNLGFSQDGGFQDYCLVDSRQVALIPESLSSTQAAPLMCAGLTIWGALSHESVQKAKIVAIIGAGGGLGHNGLQFAARLGKDVLAIEASDPAVEVMKRVKSNLGEDRKRVHVADARKNDASIIRALAKSTDGCPSSEVGVEAVILLPESQKAFDLGLKLLRNHGTMVIVSFPIEKFVVSAREFVHRDITIRGTLVARNYQLREMLEFVVKHNVYVEVTSYCFNQLNDLANPALHGAGGKRVIDMTLKCDG